MKNRIALVLAMGALLFASACDDDSTESVAKCTEGATQCSASGIPQKCVGGVWGNMSACASGLKCASGVCVADPTKTCTDNALECSAAGVPQKCVKGAWVDQAACTSGTSCVSGFCQKAGDTTKCTDGATQCSAAGVPQKCVSGAWVDQAACTNGQKCISGACSSESVPAKCTDGATQCSTAGVPQKCVSGAWVDQAACTNGQTCVGGACSGSGEPAKCTDGATQCSAAGVPQKCVSGAWVDQTACANGTTCKNGNCEGGSSSVTTEDDLVCSAADDLGVCKTYNGESWAFYCIDGEAEVDPGMLQGNCTSFGMKCILDEEMGESWCGCETNADCPSDMPLCSDDNFCYECDSDADCVGNANGSKCDEDWGYCVACLSDSDCGEGEVCTNNEETDEYVCEAKGEDDECSAAACKAVSGEDYQGDACVEVFGEVGCGCNSDADCSKSGYKCNSYGVCIKEEGGDEECELATDCEDGEICVEGACKKLGTDVDVPKCEKDEDGSFCKTVNGIEWVVVCYDGEIEMSESDACTGETPYCSIVDLSGYRYGECTDEKSGGEVSSSEVTVVFESSSCSALKKANADIAEDGCDDTNYKSKTATLTFANNMKLEFNVNAQLAGNTANLKTNAQYIKATNVPAGSTVKVTWSVSSAANKLTIADNASTSKSQTFELKTADALQTDSFEMSASATGFMLSHADGGTNVIKIKSITVTSK